MRKVISRSGEKEFTMDWAKIQKFTGKNKRKSGQSKLERKKHTLKRFLRLMLSRAFSFLGRLMKTLFYQRLAKYVINSLLLCNARHGSNKFANRNPGWKTAETSTLCWRPFRLWHLSVFGTGSLNQSFSHISCSFNISNFFRCKLNVTPYCN